jgi:hypothetical protein
MKTWITSLVGATTLSFLHLMIELWRSFLDFSLIFPDYTGGNTGSLALGATMYTAIFAFWLVGLANARQAKRGGVIAAALVGALFWIGLDLGTIFFYCPGGCESILFDINTYLALIVGALALYGLAVNFRARGN